MDITWHGNTCLTLKDKDRSIVINPDREAGKLTADFVLTSLGEDSAKVEEAERVLDWPGEYEMKGVPIIGLAAQTKSEDGEPTEIFYFEMNNIKVCHLGDLGHALTSEQVKQIGNVDVLIINASEGSNLTLKRAMEIIEAIDPRIVIPVGAGNQAAFLKELGAEAIAAESKFSLKSASDLPDESRQIAVLSKS